MKKVIAGLVLCISAVVLLVVRVLGPGEDVKPARRVLRVCSDPNNLPFSNERREGMENRIAEILARDLDADLEYTWWAQRRGYVRNTLRADACDVLISAPAASEMVLVTAPYYRSTYVFVTRKADRLRFGSLDSPLLRNLRVGVQLVGDDGVNSPPAHALARRGIVQNVQGYRVNGDYREPNPPARIIDAVAAGEIDVAIAWGPLAGYFAKREGVALELEPVEPQVDLPFLPFVFDISMGVRRGEDRFRAELDAAIERNRAAIEKVLDDYGVPRVAMGS